VAWIRVILPRATAARRRSLTRQGAPMMRTPGACTTVEGGGVERSTCRGLMGRRASRSIGGARKADRGARQRQGSPGFPFTREAGPGGGGGGDRDRESVVSSAPGGEAPDLRQVTQAPFGLATDDRGFVDRGHSQGGTSVPGVSARMTWSARRWEDVSRPQVRGPAAAGTSWAGLQDSTSPSKTRTFRTHEEGDWCGPVRGRRAQG